MTLQKKLPAIILILLPVLSFAQDKSPDIKPNNISVIFFQFTENGLGFGANYERMISKRGKFSFSIPAIATFNIANSNRIYDYNTGNYNTGKTNPMYYAMPGIKFYPTGGYGYLKYATGLSLAVGAGKISGGYVNNFGLNVTERIQSHFIAGGMFQNSLSMNAGGNIYVGIEIGVGSSFVNKVGGANVSNEFLIQGALKAGYRF